MFGYNIDHHLDALEWLPLVHARQLNWYHLGFEPWTFVTLQNVWAHDLSTMSMRGKWPTNAPQIIKALYKKSATAGPRTFGQRFWVFFNSKGFFLFSLYGTVP